MAIQYFYNFCIADGDDTDLSSDIFSAVRKGYFATFDKIRDKITYDSEGVSMLYDYCIEKDKPLRWTVKTTGGKVVQDVVSADNGRYYLCFYRDDMIVKRLLFSKLHTLLKAEYMDSGGAVSRTVEPRKVQGGLCLLYTDKQLAEPLVLSEAPWVSDERVKQRLCEEFEDYTVTASTNEGVVWYLSDAQTARYKELVDQITAELENESEASFVDDAPLYERINAKDFNMKRNLSASLDISRAKDFGAAVQEAEPVDNPTEEKTEAEETLAVEAEAPAADTEDIAAGEEDVAGEEKAAAAQPDKLIMADGVYYSYYGELDERGDRSGYGRTMTDLGRTAYEGEYRGDKRSGKGAYFYKDGTLCYSGDWSENVRHGVGVGISARDGSMHIGRWANNKPEGNGVRMTADGEIKFVCKELADGGTVLMNYLNDDTVVISKYDKSGSKLSEKIVSLSNF